MNVNYVIRKVELFTSTTFQHSSDIQTISGFLRRHSVSMDDLK